MANVIETAAILIAALSVVWLSVMFATGYPRPPHVRPNYALIRQLEHELMPEIEHENCAHCQRPSLAQAYKRGYDGYLVGALWTKEKQALLDGTSDTQGDSPGPLVGSELPGADGHAGTGSLDDLAIARVNCDVVSTVIPGAVVPRDEVSRLE